MTRARQGAGLVSAVCAFVALASPRAAIGGDHRLTVGGGTIDVSITGEASVSELWRRLGVRRVGGRVIYDDSTALADVRVGIVGGSPADRHARVPGELR